MYQGGYSNFAAKRAARHGRTKQYKESLANSKKNEINKLILRMIKIPQVVRRKKENRQHILNRWCIQLPEVLMKSQEILY